MTVLTKEVFTKADIDGYVEVSSCIYLHSQESIISDQKNWGDEDECEHIDFTTAPYWLVTDNGICEPIHDLDDLKKLF